MEGEGIIIRHDTPETVLETGPKMNIAFIFIVMQRERLTYKQAKDFIQVQQIRLRPLNAKFGL
jgi:hypothetical protein